MPKAIASTATPANLRQLKVDEFLQARSLQPESEQAYRRDLQCFMQWTPQACGKVTRRQVAQFKQYLLQERKLAPNIAQPTSPSSSIDYTLILNGVLTEILFSPWLKIFDFESGVFQYWGDGETLFDTTTIANVADFAAEAVLDSGLANQVLDIAGDTLNMKQLHATYEQMTGQTLQVKQLGSVDQLRQWIEQTKAQAQSPYAYLPQQYLYAMVSGKGRLDQLQNQRYPQIQMASIAQFIPTIQPQPSTI